MYSLPEFAITPEEAAGDYDWEMSHIPNAHFNRKNK